MPIQPIDIGSYLKAGFDPIAGAMPIAQNVLIDKMGAVRRRPVLVTNTDIAPATPIDTNGIDLIHVTNGGDTYALGGLTTSRAIYKIKNGSFVTLSDVTTGRVEGVLRPSSVETEALLVFVAGGKPQKIVLATDLSSRLGGNPPTGTHIIGNSSRLLLNDIVIDKTKINFSDIAGGTVYAGHEVWGVVAGATSGFFTAEARPDPVVALGELNNSVLVFGSTSLQIYAPDATWIYSSVVSLETGCIAPYSLIKTDNTYAWLDQYKRFVMSDGTSVKVISDHISPVLFTITHPENCYGYRVRTEYSDNLVWTFPDDGRTFCLDSSTGWSQWCKWDTVDNVNGPMDISSVCYDPYNNVTLAGTLDGHLKTFSHTESSEIPFFARVRTGYSNRGTDSLKECQALYFTINRGNTDYSETSSITVSWSDSPERWTRPIVINLGKRDSRTLVVPLRGLGTYRMRAWEFTFSGRENMVISSITEQFENTEA